MTEEQSFDSIAIAESDLQVEALVASRVALLQRERREQRIDIIVSSILAILNGRGPLDQDSLRQAVSSLWRTGSIPSPLFDNALAAAKRAGFITEQPGLDHRDRLDIVASLKRDIDLDRDWVAGVLRDLHEEVERRLLDYADDRLDGKANKVVRHLIAAVARGLVGYGVERPAAEKLLLPLEIDEREIARYARSLQPKSQRRPVLDLALAAVDPDDEFGSDAVHLLVAGNLLHGMVTQQDAGPRSLEGVRLLLDTSVLLSLVNEGSPSEQILRKAIKASNEMDIEVFVAQHTVEEWNRQWEFADDEARAITGNTIPILASRFEKNPFLRSYLSVVERPEELSFQAWAANRRQLPRLLDEMNVKVIGHGIVKSENRDRVEAMKRTLLETGRRSEKGAKADAHSAVMVAKWREERGADTSFFIAAERFTGQAFKKLIDPDHALVVSPQAWLIYVSNLGTDSPNEAADLAELIADAMVRNTMLELACAYTFEEVLALSEVLMEAGTITPQDARELGAPQLFEIDELTEEDLSPEEMGARLLVLKSRRERERAERMRKTATETEAVAQARVQKLEKESSRFKAEAEQQLSAKTAEIEGLTQERDEAFRSASQQRLLIRRMIVGFTVLALAAVMAVGHASQWWPPVVTWIAALVLVWLLLQSKEYMTNVEEGFAGLLIPAVSELLLLAVAALWPVS